MKFFRQAIPTVLFFLLLNAAAFSSEDIGKAIRQENETPDEKDVEPYLILGKKIIAQDPQSIEGYKLILIHALFTKNMNAFLNTIDDFKEQGAPEPEIDYLAADMLYLVDYFGLALLKLADFEKAWREKYAQK